MHWGFAALSAAGFLGLTFLFFDVGRTRVRHLLTSALTTATFGILLLVVFQWMAMFSQGFNLRGGNIIVALFYIIKLIGYSYRLALDPDVGFLPSFAGFIFGVGLCEELVKAVPVLFRVQNDDRGDDWRTASMWGFASGIGFGVGEGIMYSSDYYNGLASGDIYLVRFISCVALHAIWSAGVGVAVWRHRRQFEHGMGWVEWSLFVLRVIFVSMVLHGLYDTLLKCEYDVWALVVGLASFAWLFGYLEFVRRTNDPETAAA
jgi:RsiW-degrading membrane proteinase PrsW (M82 family)